MVKFRPRSVPDNRSFWQKYRFDILFQVALLLLLFWMYQDCGALRYTNVTDGEGELIKDGFKAVCWPEPSRVLGWMLLSLSLNLFYRNLRYLPFYRWFGGS